MTRVLKVALAVKTRHANAMALAFSRIGLTGKPGDASVRALIGRLLERVRALGAEVLVDAAVAHGTAAPGVTGSELAERVELVICVGGDGTLLHAARQYGLAGLPLIGVNLGRMGFLVDLTPDDLDPRLDQVLAGDFAEEQRLMLEVRTDTGGRTEPAVVALNDVVLHKADPSRLLEFSTHIDGRGVTTHRADGIVVATPTGSTAYALSAGGPILHPAMDSLVMVPICPHTLSDRPLVVPASSRIDIRVGPHTGGAQVSCDGQPGRALAPGDSISVGVSDRSIRLLHPVDYDYFRILRDKLQWGREP